MHSQKKYHLALTGGGTGGHVWPNLALFQNSSSELSKAYKNGHVKVYYFGSRHGIESSIIRKNMPDFTYLKISTGKLRRYFSLKTFIEPFFIVLGFLQSFYYLKKYNIACLFSKGGFVSAPVVWAAWLLRIPIFIHESDSSPALATKLCLPMANKAIFSFGEAISMLPKRFHKKCLTLGLPVRETLFNAKIEEARKFFGIQNSQKTILLFGGSLGAVQLFKKLESVIPELCKTYNVIHITGEKYKVKESFRNLKNYYTHRFLNHEMRYAYAMSDLAICRAGASSLFELKEAAIPMILYPLGTSASRGDQIVNAKIFKKHKWASLFYEDKFKGEDLLLEVENIMGNLERYKKKLASKTQDSACKKIGDLIWASLSHKQSQ